MLNIEFLELFLLLLDGGPKICEGLNGVRFELIVSQPIIVLPIEIRIRPGRADCIVALTELKIATGHPQIGIEIDGLQSRKVDV